VIKRKQSLSFRNKKITLLLLSVGIFAGLSAFGYGAFKNRSLTSTDVKSSAAGGCTVDAKLVNSCRPWLAAAVGGYTMAGSNTMATQFEFFEKRLNNPNVLNNPSEPTTINKKLDFIHIYKGRGYVLDATTLTYVNRPNTYLQLNWKPNDGAVWNTADGRDSGVNADIDKTAQSIKSVAPKKVMLSVFHEPEDNVTPGSAGSCTNTSAGGSNGSPADYVNMWQNVRNRFDALGVNNVVWNVNYMGWDYYNCLIPLLYPGNGLVDWVTYDPYVGGTKTLTDSGGMTKKFYDYLTSSSDAQHDYLSKPWGFSEHGYWNKDSNSTEAQAPIYWQQAKSAIENNTFPKIKLWSVFDTNGNEPYTFASLIGLQFNMTVTPNIAEQTAYNDFATSILNKEIVSPTNNADLNSDTKVNIQDLSILISKWSTNTQPADINKDGIVNIQDLSILISKWTG